MDQCDFVNSISTTAPCKICYSTQNNKLFHTRDFQLPSQEIFSCLECGNCHCVQLTNKPNDLSKYYPKGYYSHSVTYSPSKKSKWDKDVLRARNLTGSPNISSFFLGIIDRIRNRNNTLIPLRCTVKAGVKFDDSILDVGCGTGFNILDLVRYGYRRATGIDPFIENDLCYPNGVEIYKKTIHEINDVVFDFITFHHSFEHMDDPLEVLIKSRTLLKPGKFLLIRMPVADGYGWKQYRGYWMGLDAPRHLMLHTTKSMGILAEDAGMILEKVDIEKKSSYLLESEIRLQGVKTLDKNDEKKIKSLAEQLASQGIADCAAFYLRRPA